MSLFKVNRGNESNLPIKLTDGWAYFCTDTGSFLIDHYDSTNTLVRSKINAEFADKLRFDHHGEMIEITAEDINDAMSRVDTHKHNAGTDITSGILPVARGGTGNGSGYVRVGQKSGTDIGYSSTAEGVNNTASGSYAHVEGRNNVASGDASHAEGQENTASGSYAHVEGYGVTATSPYSHAEGLNTTVSGNRGSHAEGDGATASGQTSHAEGLNTVASGNYCHAEGTGTIAAGSSQHVQGTYNIEHKGIRILHVVGNGSSDTDRSDAHTLDWKGNAWFAGNVYVGGSGQDDGVALASTMSVTTAEYQTMSTNNQLKESTLYMLTDDTSEEDLQATVDDMNNIDYDTYLAFDTTEIV